MTHKIWQQKVFEPAGPSTFIPIQKLYCKFACVNVGQQKAVRDWSLLMPGRGAEGILQVF